MGLHLGVGGVDDHLTPNKSQVLFDPSRHTNKKERDNELDKFSEGVYDMIQGELAYLEKLGIQGLPKSKDNLKEMIENDPKFAVMLLAILGVKRKTREIAHQVGIVSSRTESIRTFGL